MRWEEHFDVLSRRRTPQWGWRVLGASPPPHGSLLPCGGGVPHFFTTVPPPISWWQDRGELAGKIAGHNMACDLTSPDSRVCHSRTRRTGPTAADREVGPLVNRGLHNLAIVKSAAVASAGPAIRTAGLADAVREVRNEALNPNGKKRSVVVVAAQGAAATSHSIACCPGGSSHQP